MNRRRKVGSTLILSSVAALAIVGMGLAAAVTPVSTEASFGFEFVPTPDVPTDIGVLTAPDMTNIKLVVDETSKKVSLKNPIVFTFTPDESIADHTFELTYTFAMPENFDDYFTLTTPLTGTIEADDASTLAAETDITFTIGTDKIAGTLTGDFDEAQAAFAESSINVSATVNDVTGSEPADIAVESVTLNEEAKTLAPSESFKLSATIAPENATDRNLTWDSSDDSVATVDQEGNVTAVATATDGQTATITVTSANGKSDSCVITIAVPEQFDSITDINTDGTKYTVQGVVDAKTTQGLVVTDGNASIYVWFGKDQGTALDGYAIGDVVKVSGTVTSYNGMLQFALPTAKATNDATIEKVAESTGIKAAEPTVLTKEIADSWASAESFTQADFKEYTWSTVVGKTGNYFTLNIDGSSTVIQPSYYADNSSLIEGATYTVTGYFGGYNTTYNYAAIYVTDMEKTADPVLTDIAINGVSSVAVGGQTTLTASGTPGTASLQDIVWSIAAGDDYVDISAEGTSCTVTGVSIGSATIRASVGSVSKDFTIEVTDAQSAEKTLVADYSFGWDGYSLSGSDFTNDSDLQSIASTLNNGGTTIASEVTTAVGLATSTKHGGVKLSSKNTAGQLVFTTPVLVNKIDVKVVGWSGAQPSFSVGDGDSVSEAFQVSKSSDGKMESAETFTVSFTDGTNSISIVGQSGNNRFAVVGITLYY